MKRYWIFGLILLRILTACSDSEFSDINGMWQLNTISNKSNNIQVVDTIYYSFQHHSIFSYTILNGDKAQTDPTVVIYGYADFPEKNKLHIQLDKGFFYNHPELLLWEGTETTYNLLQLSGKKMVLEQDENIYHFTKF
jgi:hypothetical protein